MKIRAILTSLFLMVAMVAAGQELKMESFELLPVDMTAKVNPVYDLNSEACGLVRVAIGSEEVTFQGIIVGTPQYKGGEWLVYVPQGTKRLKVSRDGYLPLTVEFDKEIEQFRTYELRISTPNNKDNKVLTLVMPTVAFGYSPMNYGLMVGVVKKKGGYVKYKSNFKGAKSSFDVDGAGVDANGVARWFDDSETFKRWSVTAGYIQRLSPKFYLYGGLGYGARTLLWLSSNGDYATVTPSSFKGVEVEVGAMMRFGSFAVGAGVQSNPAKFVEANVSAGIMF